MLFMMQFGRKKTRFDIYVCQKGIIFIIVHVTTQNSLCSEHIQTNTRAW